MSGGWNNIEALSQGEWRYNVACLRPGSSFIYVLGMHVYILIMEWPNAYNITESVRKRKCYIREPNISVPKRTIHRW